MKKDELELVKYIRNKFPFTEGIGIGDDSAVLLFRKSALLTTDLMIEDVHFDLSYTSFYHLGFKIVSVNVSDIYAMGGDFKGFLFSLGVPVTTNEEDIDSLFDGIEDALNYYGGYLIGGDLSRSEKVILSGVAVGETERPILRKGATAGDRIFITSYLGLSQAGYYVLKSLNQEDRAKVKSTKYFDLNEKIISYGKSEINEALQRHLMPFARKSDKFRDIAKAMMDISDGLLIDLYRLCEESKVGAEIYVDQIPVHPAVKEIAKLFNMDPLKLILSGGEDYELIVISDKIYATEVGLIPIGKIVEGEGIYLVDPSKGKIPTKPEGWQHF
ncbi:thiamine-monophosphate kinase [Thermodesulfovibrio aggregans]|uniref:Thiamine-monophosphate kinase n=1 Tax=Thermodesulfovibrio aggregans TaxID=86166 RepID=A0A0U9HX07_9BACT|nr:thiamine-phosphate kinase [Thermodesulfovibrio aggregans]GAQ95087.1 thiamine-monophosphate kinase [Thermodesulfovibrio aggregans]